MSRWSTDSFLVDMLWRTIFTPHELCTHFVSSWFSYTRGARFFAMFPLLTLFCAIVFLLHAQLSLVHVPIVEIPFRVVPP